VDVGKGAELTGLLTRIYEERGIDFTQYKLNTITRRIGSRLSRRGVSSMEEYLAVLDRDASEYDSLIEALTINVTEFFRNPKSFAAIRDIVIPAIIADKRAHLHRIIRVWSCGCAGGDEAYSAAILLDGKLGKAIDRFSVSVTGTDVSESTLAEARKGKYTAARLKAMDPELVKKYFTENNAGEYSVRRGIKDMVKFQRHDVVSDPPFRRCDVILCRNLLIYFNRELQADTVLKLRDCLNPGGFLVLGMAETMPGRAMSEFDTVNGALRVYRRPERDRPGIAEGLLSQDDIDRIVGEMLA
jgi:chemotaxis protein methyltransferase CheR